MPPTILKAYANTPLGQIHYRYSIPHGSIPPKPAGNNLLMLHMSATDSASFTSLMEYYTMAGYTCFAPDMPGFGGSFDPAPDPPAISWYVKLYNGIFSRMPEFEGGCHVIGHHSGGGIGTELAVLHPNFVKSLTLIGPAIMTADERAAFAETTMVAFNKPVADGSHLSKTWEYLTQTEQPGWLHPIGNEPGCASVDLIQRETLAHARAWKGRLQIYSCVWKHDGRDLLPQVKCPVLALCAEDDLLWPLFGQVKEVRPETETGVITGGNFGPDRGKDGIAKHLDVFLEKLLRTLS
jgi:pimeloyl-ACP methyl ester carboxylesterase